MRVVFFRHGIAEPREPAREDAERTLTPRGRERTLAAAQGLARLIEQPGVVLTSPKRRAHETACIVAEAFDIPVVTAGVIGEGSPTAIARLLGDRPESNVVLVGHEPTMSAVIELLVGGRPRGNVELKKAGVAVVDTRGADARPGEGCLLALLPPRVLRALALGVDAL